MSMNAGTSCLICSVVDVFKLNLKQDSSKHIKKFAGLWNATGCAIKKVIAQIGNKSSAIKFYMVDKTNLPVLFNKIDIKKIRIHIGLNQDILVNGSNNSKLCSIFFLVM